MYLFCEGPLLIKCCGDPGHGPHGPPLNPALVIHGYTFPDITFGNSELCQL